MCEAVDYWRLQLHQYAEIDEPASEVVGHRVVVVVDVLYPVIGVYVVDTQQVECVYSKPNILEILSHSGAVVSLLVVEQPV